MAVVAIARRAVLTTATRGVRHLGYFGVGPVSAPPSLAAAIEKELASRPEYPTPMRRNDAVALSSFLRNRGVPDVVLPEACEPPPGKAKSPKAATVQHKHAIAYREREALAYLTSQQPLVYASLLRTLSEVAAHAPGFQPRSVLDFGSGVGSSVWAVDEVWQGSACAHTCVDSSLAMLDLSARLLESNPESPDEADHPPVRYRQFLPPGKDAYDMVVAAHSLSDLPSAQARCRLLDDLWARTRGVLVLVDHGDPLSFQMMLAARSYLLGSPRPQPAQQKRRSGRLGGRHRRTAARQTEHPDGESPRAPSTMGSPKNSPLLVAPVCNPRHRHLGHAVEKFSFLVLARQDGPYAEHLRETHQWPRIVAAPRKRKGLVLVDTCIPAGPITETTITRAHGADVWRGTKQREWGDLFPPDVYKQDRKGRQADVVF